MKHTFQNLKIDSKNKEAGIRLDTYAHDVGDYLTSCRNLKKSYDTYYTKYSALEDRLNDVVNESVYYSDDLEKVNHLLDSILGEGLTDIAKSKPWKDLLDLIEDDYAKKLQKEQKDLDNARDAFQFTSKMSLEIIKDLHKKLS